MNVIVDTSVWSLILRRGVPNDNSQTQKFMALLDSRQEIMLIGVIIQELLQGIRNNKDFLSVKEHLDVFTMIELDRHDYIYAAELRNHCLSHGINAGTIDFLIAAACIRHDCVLLTCDNDFNYIASCSSLQLL